jgi:nucleoside-diphosphate-sugar epimerase
VAGVVAADLLESTASELAAFVAGADAIVHCAYHRPASDDPQSQYDGERCNVDLMQLVYQLALSHGVRRVVAASTNQATNPDFLRRLEQRPHVLEHQQRPQGNRLPV